MLGLVCYHLLSRLDTTVGDETGLRDLDGSMRLARTDGCSQTGREIGDNCIPFPVSEQDISYEAIELGDLELTPVFVNALFHWGTERADFYAGAGLGLILADITLSDEYRDFTGDRDDAGDIQVDDSLAMNFKIGSNMRLGKSGRAYLFFEVSYFSTGLLGGSQVEWTGTVTDDGENGVFLGDAVYDLNNDGTVSDPFPADLRIVDPGKVRIDGASAGLGIRFRFGGPKPTASMDESAGF